MQYKTPQSKMKDPHRVLIYNETGSPRSDSSLQFQFTDSQESEHEDLLSPTSVGSKDIPIPECQAYQLRITFTDKDGKQVSTCNIEEVKDYISTISPYRYAYTIESNKDGNHQHIHAYIHSELNPRTLRSQLVKLTGKGNERYSLKKLDPDEEGLYTAYLAYLLKEPTSFEEKDNVVIGYNQDKEILQFININEGEIGLAFEHLKKVNLDQEKRKKKQVKVSIFKELEQDLKIEHEKYLPNLHYKQAYKEVATFILDWYLKKDKLIKEFDIKATLTTLGCKYSPEWRRQLIENTLQPLWLYENQSQFQNEKKSKIPKPPCNPNLLSSEAKQYFGIEEIKENKNNLHIINE